MEKFDEVCKTTCYEVTNNQLVKVGKNIKRLRLKSGLSQADVGFYIFSDKSLISSLERGVQKNVTLFTLNKIAKLFYVDLEDLFNDD